MHEDSYSDISKNLYLICPVCLNILAPVLTYVHLPQSHFSSFLQQNDLYENATEFIKSGGDIWELKNILGHSSINTTSIYLHMAEDFKNVYSPLNEVANE